VIRDEVYRTDSSERSDELAALDDALSRYLGLIAEHPDALSKKQ